MNNQCALPLFVFDVSETFSEITSRGFKTKRRCLFTRYINIQYIILQASSHDEKWLQKILWVGASKWKERKFKENKFIFIQFPFYVPSSFGLFVIWKTDFQPFSVRAKLVAPSKFPSFSDGLIIFTAQNTTSENFWNVFESRLEILSFWKPSLNQESALKLWNGLNN